MSSRSTVAQQEVLRAGPPAPASVAANAALVSSIRSARHDAERRSLLRKSAAARALQVEERSERPEPAIVGPARELDPPLQTSCASWRSTAARQAYLSTLPPPPSDAAPVVHISHKA